MHTTQPSDAVSMGDERNRLIQEALERLAPFLGLWSGQGRGGYPTLEGFAYAETLRIQRDPGAQYLTYEQSTELVDPHGQVIRKSHWEAGILRPLTDGSIELACVQGSGRLEVLRGELTEHETDPGITVLKLASVLIGNDARVKRSSREWTLEEDHFNYVMHMATTQVEALTRHLQADLYKRQ